MLDHKHLLISAEVSNLPKDLAFLRNWYVSLIEKIRMNLVPSSALLNNATNPIVYDCSICGNEGITIAGVIETSHVVVHTWTLEDRDRVELDVYSCSDFNPEEVISHLRDFSLISIHYKFIDRNSGLKEVKI